MPSAPAAIVGFESLPEAGESFVTGPDVGDLTAKASTMSVQGSAVPAVEGEAAKLKVSLKADTSGSLEALRGIFGDKLQITDYAVGNITDGDIKNAITTGSIIVGFNVKIDKATENLAQAQHVEVITSDIIYRLTEAIDLRLKSMEMSKPIAELNILKVFGVTGRRQTIGGKVTLGLLKGGMTLKISRADNVLGEGKILNVQVGKRDVTEVTEGLECGILFESDITVRVGDNIQLF